MDRLDTTMLAKILNKLHEEAGRGFFSDLEKLSGTSNLGRIAKKQINPKKTTWEKLHAALPHKIPPPAEKSLFNITGDNNVQTGNSVSEAGQSVYYSADIQEIADLLHNVMSPIEIKKLKEKLLKIKEEREGGIL